MPEDPPKKPTGQDERLRVEAEDPEDVLRGLMGKDRDQPVPQDEPLKDQGDAGRLSRERAQCAVGG
jgi:hypothetical protein